MSSIQYHERGRKIHNFYEELQFINLKLDSGRTAAQRAVCNCILKNTSISRLQTHRNRCYATNSSEDEREDETIIIIDEDCHKESTGIMESNVNESEVKGKNQLKNDNENEAFSISTTNSNAMEETEFNFDANNVFNKVQDMSLYEFMDEDTQVIFHNIPKTRKGEELIGVQIHSDPSTPKARTSKISSIFNFQTKNNEMSSSSLSSSAIPSKRIMSASTLLGSFKNEVLQKTPKKESENKKAPSIQTK